MEKEWQKKLSTYIFNKMFYPNLGNRMMYNKSMELVPDTTSEQNVNPEDYTLQRYQDPLLFLNNNAVILDARLGETVMVKKPTIKQRLLSPLYRTKDNFMVLKNFLTIGDSSNSYLKYFE